MIDKFIKFINNDINVYYSNILHLNKKRRNYLKNIFLKLILYRKLISTRRFLVIYKYLTSVL